MLPSSAKRWLLLLALATAVIAICEKGVPSSRLAGQGGLGTSDARGPAPDLDGGAPLSAPPGSGVTERTLRALSSGDSVRRSQVLAELLDAGSSDPRLTPTLRQVVDDPETDPLLRARAMVMLMRLTHTSEYVDQVARLSVAGRFGDSLLRMAVGSDAGIILAAARRLAEAPFEAEAEADLSSAIRSPAAFTRQLEDDLASAGDAALLRALQLSRGLEPQPDSLLTGISRALAAKGDALLRTALAVLAVARFESSADTLRVADAVALRLPGLSADLRTEALFALAWLGEATELVQRGLLECVAQGRSRHAALWALQSFGRLASDASPALQDLASMSPSRERPPYLAALSAIASDRYVSYLNERLDNGTTEERIAILANGPLGTMHSSDYRDRVWRLCRSGDPSVQGSAIRAAARCDPSLVHATTTDIILASLLSHDSGRQIAAIASLGDLTRVPTDLLRGLFGALAETDDRVLQAANLVILGLARDSASIEALRPVVMAQLAVDLQPRARAVLLEAAGIIAPSEPTVRTALRTSLSLTRSPEERGGAIRGFLSVVDPTEDEVRLVALQLGTNELINDSLQVLHLPSWRQIVEQGPIQLLHPLHQPYR